jgi:tRNA uridine 5-carboxymethylaminomethyl modification enzyme
VKQSALAAARQEARGLSLTPSEAGREGLKVNADGQRRDLLQLLAYPSIGFGELARIWPQLERWPAHVREQIEIEALYAGYLDRQQADADAFRREEQLALPAGLDYAAIGGLSNEVREKLATVRPLTLGQAARIEGVTPGAIAALLAHVKRAKAA